MVVPLVHDGGGDESLWHEAIPSRIIASAPRTNPCVASCIRHMMNETRQGDQRLIREDAEPGARNLRVSIDVIALLRVPSPPAHRVIRKLDDGWLLHFGRWYDADDEIAFQIRSALGETLDAHDDPRGILVFPDVASPSAHTYDGIVRELGDDARWVPRVSADFLPRSLRDAKEGSVEAMTRDAHELGASQMLEEMIRAHQSGDEAAMQRMREKMEAIAKELEKKHPNKKR
jgi:hypothetical protein